LDKHALPTWYDDSKVGIFIHRSIFNAFVCITKSGEKISLFVYRMWWAWKGTKPNPRIVDFMNKNYPADWTYADFAAQFRAELYG
jgi:alpha-L-fucosidase